MLKFSFYVGKSFSLLSECDASKRKTTAQLDLPTFGCAIDVGIEWKLHDLEAFG